MKTTIYTFLMLILLVFSSCSKDDPYFLFEVDNVEVEQSNAEKNQLKTDIEFVSIAYNDLYGSNIPQNQLEEIITSYKSFGDKSLVIELIIKKFILDDGSDIPSLLRISRESVDSFVVDAYEKLYNRSPNAFENWHMTELILNNGSID
ncbi:MAG: hypothetical protein VXY06_02340, partial [Bacteroidota bacterium]|nr:hypothetical protein [Bacteroidota bacterium]